MSIEWTEDDVKDAPQFPGVDMSGCWSAKIPTKFGAIRSVRAEGSVVIAETESGVPVIARKLPFSG